MGPANALIPVVKALQKELPVSVYADSEGKGKDAFEKAKLNFDVVDRSRPIPLESKIVLTGTTPIMYDQKTPTHWGRESETWALASQKGIKSIALLDKYNKSESRGRFLRLTTNELVFPGVVAVPNSISAVSLFKEFLDYDLGIQVTGNPYFDDIPNKKANAKRPYTDSKAKIIPVLLSSEKYMRSNGTSNISLLEIAAEAVEGENALLVVKAHPKDSPQELHEYEHFLRIHHGNFDCPGSSEDLVLSLRDDEFCIGTNSSLLEVATLADIHGLSIWPVSNTDDSYKGMVPYAHSKEEGIKLIRSALQDRDFRDRWESNRRSYIVDGKATERVVNLVKEYIK